VPAPKAPATKIAEMLAAAEAKLERLQTSADNAKARYDDYAAQLKEQEKIVAAFKSTAKDLGAKPTLVAAEATAQ
jgi:di/tripeptidase